MRRGSVADVVLACGLLGGCAASPSGTTAARGTTVAKAPPAPAPVPAVARPEPRAPRAPAEPCETSQVVPESAFDDPIRGSFREPNQEEMFGRIRCRPTTDAQDFDGHGLARKVAGAWELLQFIPGQPYSVTRCQPLALGSGRDLVICIEGVTSNGATYQQVFALDFESINDEHQQLVSVADTTHTACRGEREVVIAELDDPVLVDLDQDGIRDVRVVVRARSVRIPPQPPCEGDGVIEPGPSPPNLPRPPPRKLEFMTRGARPEPTDKSQRVLDDLAKLAR